MNWLSSLLSKKEKLVVGLSSGTSMDGIDAALVAISGSGADTEVRIEDFICRDYSPTAKGILFAPHALEAADVSDLNFQLGSEFAEAVVEILRRNGLETTDVDLVGSHGQTIFHNPPSLNFDIPSTLQVGEPDVICEETGITTVADFRTRDLAAGGEGAPLVPYADFILFSGTGKNIIAQNIGGISNCALVTGKFEELIAFDTGPGNSLVDSVVRIDSDDEMFYDKDGAMASEGSVDEGLLRELMRDFYLRRKPPKSTGTERFGMEMADQYFLLVENGELAVEDLLRTLVEFTARSIADAYERFVTRRPTWTKWCSAAAAPETRSWCRGSPTVSERFLSSFRTTTASPSTPRKPSPSRFSPTKPCAPTGETCPRPRGPGARPFSGKSR